VKDKYAGLRAALARLNPGDVSSIKWIVTPPNQAVDEYIQIAEPRMIRALLQERDALMADAERYRWLREQHWNDADMAVVCHPRSSVKLGFDCPSRDRLDDAIDAARSKRKEGS
jgi:hypothetical protein